MRRSWFWSPQFWSSRAFIVGGTTSIIVGLMLAAVITYTTGGTYNATPHLFYIPIVGAAFMFRTPGGLITGLAAGLISGPFMPLDVALAIPQPLENWIIRLSCFIAIGMLTGNLAGQLRQHIRELKALNEQTIMAFVEAIDSKDEYTARHSTTVAVYAKAIAQELGLPAADVERIQRAALLHDIGKIAVPIHILNKNGPLTAEELAIVQRHPFESAKILRGVDQFKPYIDGVLQHHERMDGTGYPHALPGSLLSLDGRIIAVADAFEAMTSARAYRPPLSRATAINELKLGAGTQFDPQAVDALLRVLEPTGPNTETNADADVDVDATAV